MCNVLRVCHDYIFQINALLLISGKGGTHDAFHTCYVYRNALFSNDFFTRFSWSGGKRNGVSKEGFKLYAFFRNFFITLLRHSHADFSEAMYEEFFKNRVIRNSGSRAKAQGIREPTVKHRRSKDDTGNEQIQETLTGAANSKDQVENSFTAPTDEMGEKSVSNDVNGDEDTTEDDDQKAATTLATTTSGGDEKADQKADELMPATTTSDGVDTSVVTAPITASSNIDMYARSTPSTIVELFKTISAQGVVSSTDAMPAPVTKRPRSDSNAVVKRKRVKRVDQFSVNPKYVVDENSAESEIEDSGSVSFPDKIALTYF